MERLLKGVTKICRDFDDGMMNDCWERFGSSKNYTKETIRIIYESWRLFEEGELELQTYIIMMALHVSLQAAAA